MSSTIAPQLMTMQKEYMKSKDKFRTNLVRNISSKFKNYMIEARKDSITADEEISILKTMVKQRVDSEAQFTKAGRIDLATIERDEITFIESLLPKQLTEDEIRSYVKDIVEGLETKPTIKEIGSVMSKLSNLKSKADMAVVSKIVKQMIS